MNVHMRNKASGEIRDVEADSPEFRQLQREVTSLGQPMWEQTSFAHADSVRSRAATGSLLEEDLGFEDASELRFEALALAAQGVAPEENPHLFLTPGEIESGLTPRQKQKDLQSMYNQRIGRRTEVYQGAAERIAGDDYEGPEESVPALAGTAGSISSLAGGSDERDNAPSRGSLAATGDDSEDVGQVAPSSGGPGGSRQSGARRRTSGETAPTEQSPPGSSGQEQQAGGQ